MIGSADFYGQGYVIYFLMNVSFSKWNGKRMYEYYLYSLIVSKKYLN